MFTLASDSRRDLDEMLVHELVHAYDHCRAKDLKWDSCEAHACSEVTSCYLTVFVSVCLSNCNTIVQIRAANLSGDCKYTNEFLRGNFTFTKQHQACVRRRAELSTMMNPSCGDKKKAKEAIDAVFDKCFNDTKPFKSIPY